MEGLCNDLCRGIASAIFNGEPSSIRTVPFPTAFPRLGLRRCGRSRRYHHAHVGKRGQGALHTDAANGYTALVVACLYRSDDGSSWDLCIISEPAHGRTVRDNVDELQNYLHRNPPHAPPAVEEGEIIVDAEMPGFVPLEDDEIDLSKP
mmetsp:Transcript_18801/g.43857  ORF Transcript_18801/g.43857 Transcript_18801/m.43857 type:complete len:149 (+) Transcript_18801:1254-1700(+)